MRTKQKICTENTAWKTEDSALESAHLQLRRPTISDTLIIRNLWQDEKVRQFLGGMVPNEVIDAKVASLQDHWNKNGFGQWSVVDKKHNQVIGICGLHHSEDGIELSYMFFPTSWGKGLAKEAALASLDYGFNSLNLDKIISITQEANHYSCRLLEKIGMHHINNFRRFDATQCFYQLTQNEWGIKNE